MDKYIAVMMSKDKIQLCIPQKWYGAFDCNGYNHGINRNVKRRIFYSPFGDNIDADFTAPVYEEYMADRNACYEVFFLKMFDTKVGCLSFLEKRRILYPAVYNSRRLDEMVPNGVAEAGGGANEPEQVIGNEENLHATSMQQQLELIDEPFVNEDVFVDRVVNERIERDVEQIVEQRLEEVAEQFVERNVVQGAMQNIGSEIVVPEMEMVEHSIVELNTHIADDSQAPMSTDNQNIASGNDISATPIKVEVKNENFERFLLANASCPVIDLTHDPEEEANLAAIASHNELDDSDDEMEFLDCGPEQFVPQTLKYDFGGHDLLSGNMPFVTDAIQNRIYIDFGVAVSNRMVQALSACNEIGSPLREEIYDQKFIRLLVIAMYSSEELSTKIFPPKKLKLMEKLFGVRVDDAEQRMAKFEDQFSIALKEAIIRNEKSTEKKNKIVLPATIFNRK